MSQHAPRSGVFQYLPFFFFFSVVMMMMIIIIGRLSSCAWLKKEARASKTAWIMGDWVSGWLGGWLAG